MSLGVGGAPYLVTRSQPYRNWIDGDYYPGIPWIRFFFWQIHRVFLNPFAQAQQSYHLVLWAAGHGHLGGCLESHSQRFINPRILWDATVSLEGSAKSTCVYICLHLEDARHDLFTLRLVAFWLNWTFPWLSVGNHIFSYDGVHQRTLSQAILSDNQHDVIWVRFCAGWVYLNLHADELDPHVMFFFFVFWHVSSYSSACIVLNPCAVAFKVQQQKEVFLGPLLALGWLESCFNPPKSDSKRKGETYGHVLDPPKQRPVIVILKATWPLFLWVHSVRAGSTDKCPSFSVYAQSITKNQGTSIPGFLRFLWRSWRRTAWSPRQRGLGPWMQPWRVTTSDNAWSDMDPAEKLQSGMTMAPNSQITAASGGWISWADSRLILLWSWSSLTNDDFRIISPNHRLNQLNHQVDFPGWPELCAAGSARSWAFDAPWQNSIIDQTKISCFDTQLEDILLYTIFNCIKRIQTLLPGKMVCLIFPTMYTCIHVYIYICIYIDICIIHMYQCSVCMYFK